MVSDPYLFTFALIDTGAILSLLVYFVITISDLECDYLNAQQCCSKLNGWVLPKLTAHGFMTLLLLLHGHWILAVANLPLAVWLSYEYFTVPTGNTGVFDPTEIHNRGKLKKHMKECTIYVGYYLVFFFIYLYWTTRAHLEDHLWSADHSLRKADLHHNKESIGIVIYYKNNKWCSYNSCF